MGYLGWKYIEYQPEMIKETQRLNGLQSQTVCTQQSNNRNLIYRSN